MNFDKRVMGIFSVIIGFGLVFGSNTVLWLIIGIVAIALGVVLICIK